MSKKLKGLFSLTGMHSVFVFYIILVGLILESACEDEPRVPQCDSEIYCQGVLLDTIQRAKIYEDSKTFVDMKMKFPSDHILRRFKEFMITYNNKPTKSEVKRFLDDNFESAGQEFEKWIPNDWVDKPKFLNSIQDEGFKMWALELNHRWKSLGRKMKDEVRREYLKYSIIWVPNPVIVPGGRFREFYYWDSYWIVQGLLLSEMYETVKGMLGNFLYIVDKYGHIPNGGRIYYMQRSQPPLLIPMVKSYFEFSQDIQFIKNNIDIMDKEFDYWMTHHSKIVNLNGRNYTLAVYGDRSKGPRPESYSEDYEIAYFFKDDEQKENFYSELKAAAESGWDFSSRWFITNATNKGNLTNTKTRSIIPVELNAIIYWNAVLLSEFHNMLGNENKVNFYTDISKEWMEAVTAVLWHEEVGAWLDYDILNFIKRDYFYPTNIAPLWTGCYNKMDKDKIVRLTLKYLQNKNIMSLFPGGVPATVEHTGEQWDYPNAWPPLQHMMILGLNNTGDRAAQRLAFEIARNWVRSNYMAFKETNSMFEKYDATVSGSHGGGGEYEVVLGFGWTNGIILDLLSRYADNLTVEDPPLVETHVLMTLNNGTSNFGQIFAVLIALIISLTAGFIGVYFYKRRNSQQIVNSKRSYEKPPRAQYTELRNFQAKRSRTR